ncbi:hypothetical protein [Aquimarina spinulae]|uniref:hypothetical protein n=1 Tax=Aquimarina spinulae TaxID=1192023 RepID=UPI000D55F747|nr:hypothetical protein [Aquimarina spinulae]
MTKHNIKHIFLGLLVFFTICIASATSYTRVDCLENDCGLKRLSELLESDNTNKKFKDFIDASSENIKVFKTAHRIDMARDDAFVTNIENLKLIKANIGDDTIDEFILELKNAGGWDAWKATFNGDSIDDISLDFLIGIKNWEDKDTKGFTEALSDLDLAKLLADADDAEKIKLALSWKMLSNHPNHITADHIALITRAKTKFENGEINLEETLKEIFLRPNKLHVQDFFSSLKNADKIFGSIDIASYSYKGIVFRIHDGKNDIVCEFSKKGESLSSKKQLLNGDDVIGVYENYSIVRTGKELGFREQSWIDFITGIEKAPDWNTTYEKDLYSFLEENKRVRKVFNKAIENNANDTNDVLKIWLMLKPYRKIITSEGNFNTMMNTKNRFVYDGIKGLDGYKHAFKNIKISRDLLVELKRANTFFDITKLKGVDITFSFTKIEGTYHTNVLYKHGQICYSKKGKFHDKITLEDGEVVLETKNDKILKKGDRIGFEKGDYDWAEFENTLENWTRKEKNNFLTDLEASEKLKEWFFTRDIDNVQRYEIAKFWRILKNAKVDPAIRKGESEAYTLLETYQKNNPKILPNDIANSIKKDGWDVWVKTQLKNKLNKFIGEIAGWGTPLELLFKDFISKNQHIETLLLELNPPEQKKIAYAWQRLNRFPGLCQKEGLLKSYVLLKRKGKYMKGVHPVEVTQLVRAYNPRELTNTNRLQKMDEIKKAAISNGYDLSKPVRVIKFEDKLLVKDDESHHIFHVLTTEFKQRIIPVAIHDFNTSSKEDVKTILISKLTGNYTGEFTGVSAVNFLEYDKIKREAIAYMDAYFPNWKTHTYIDELLPLVGDNEKYKLELTIDLKVDKVFAEALKKDQGLIEQWIIFKKLNVVHAIRRGKNGELKFLKDYMQKLPEKTSEQIYKEIKEDGGWGAWKSIVTGNSTDDISLDFLEDIKKWRDIDIIELKKTLRNPDLVKLFTGANDAEKIKLVRLWKMLKENKVKIPIRLAKYLKIMLVSKDRFVYSDIKGLDGFQKAIQNKKNQVIPLLKNLEQVHTIFDPSQFKGVDITFTFIRKGSNKYYVSVHDQAGQICYIANGRFLEKRIIEGGTIVKQTEDGGNILRKENTIGFNSGVTETEFIKQLENYEVYKIYSELPTDKMKENFKKGWIRYKLYEVPKEGKNIRILHSFIDFIKKGGEVCD